MARTVRYCLSESDLRYQYRVMLRWCRLFRKSDYDWIRVAAERFRRRYPVVALGSQQRTAA